jgi:hypothetical protein
VSPERSLQKSTRKKWLLRAIKLLIALIVLWAVWGTLVDAWGQLEDHSWQFRPAWVAVSGLLYLSGLLFAGLYWHRVLRVLGQDTGLGESLRAYFVGHLGKYVPGKAMVVVIRAGMVRGERVHTSLAAASVFLETLTMMAVGAFLAAAVLAAGFRGEAPMFWGAVGLMLAAGLPTLPPVFKRLARLAGVGRSDPAVSEKLDNLGAATLLMGWGFMALAWVLLGLSYWATLEAMGIPGLDPVGQLPRYTASVAMAMVAGFLLLVLPGGIGVREAALAALMIPYLSSLTPHAELAAWASAAVLRLVWLGAELAISAILYPMGPRKAGRGPPSG